MIANPFQILLSLSLSLLSVILFLAESKHSAVQFGFSDGDLLKHRIVALHFTLDIGPAVQESYDVILGCVYIVIYIGELLVDPGEFFFLTSLCTPLSAEVLVQFTERFFHITLLGRLSIPFFRDRLAPVQKMFTVLPDRIDLFFQKLDLTFQLLLHKLIL